MRQRPVAMSTSVELLKLVRTIAQLAKSPGPIAPPVKRSTCSAIPARQIAPPPPFPSTENAPNAKVPAEHAPKTPTIAPAACQPKSQLYTSSKTAAISNAQSFSTPTAAPTDVSPAKPPAKNASVSSAVSPAKTLTFCTTQPAAFPIARSCSSASTKSASPAHPHAAHVSAQPPNVSPASRITFSSTQPTNASPTAGKGCTKNF